TVEEHGGASQRSEAHNPRRQAARTFRRARDRDLQPQDKGTDATRDHRQMSRGVGEDRKRLEARGRYLERRQVGSRDFGCRFGITPQPVALHCISKVAARPGSGDNLVCKLIGRPPCQDTLVHWITASRAYSITRNTRQQNPGEEKTGEVVDSKAQLVAVLANLSFAGRAA